MVFLKKLSELRIWKRIFYERFTEPFHLNILTFIFLLFGSYKTKINFDLILRQHNAYSIFKCAENAIAQGLRSITLIEFGVAAGAGLMNMVKISSRVSRITGINFIIIGFDSGKGMPKPNDFRDHPDLYSEGDFQMDFNALNSRLPPNAKLVIGPIEETVPTFIKTVKETSPIGYVAIDVDFYSSAKSALKIFEDPNPKKYLPLTITYLDDIELDHHNSYCGELLAVKEFNKKNNFRKIENHAFLGNKRIFQRANWIKHIFQLHILDHPLRSESSSIAKKRVLENPYL